MKKIISVIAAVCICAFSLPLSAFAQENTLYNYNSMTFEITNKKAVLVACDKNAVSLNIPDFLDKVDPQSVKPLSLEDDDNTTNDPFLDYPVVEIAEGAFSGCVLLRDINIGKNVEKIGEEVFSDCPALSEIDVSVDNALFASSQGVLYNKDISSLLSYPRAYDKTLAIPASVKSIAKYAFSLSDVDSITIPENVEQISDRAFYMSEVENVNLLGAKTVGSESFYLCRNLSQVVFSDELQLVGESAFLGCVSLLDVCFGSSKCSIMQNAFFNCPNLAAVSLGAGAEISERAFAYYYDNISDSEIVSGFTVFGFAGSDAERYAGENKLNFIDMTAQEGNWIVNAQKSVKRTCSQTGKIVLENIVSGQVQYIDLPTLSHTFSDWSVTVEADCNKDGERCRRCLVCGKTENEPIVHYGHKYAQKEIGATCTSAGKIIYTCSVCGDSYSAPSGTPLGHSYKSAVAHSVSSTKMGYISNECSRCKYVYISPESCKFVKMSGFKVLGRNQSAIKVTFNKVSGASGYIVYNAATKKSYYTASNTYTISGIAAGKACNLYVRPYKDISGKRILGPWTSPLKTGTRPTTSKLKTVYSPKSRQIKATWAGQSSATGYQIQYATNSSFTKGVKTFTIKSNKTTAKTFTKLYGKKKYYIRIRAYKNYSGFTTYGYWSSVKSVITKK